MLWIAASGYQMWAITGWAGRKPDNVVHFHDKTLTYSASHWLRAVGAAVLGHTRLLIIMLLPTEPAMVRPTMARKAATLAVLCLASLPSLAASQTLSNTVPSHGPADARVSVCFTPARSCVGQIVAAIDAAQTEIRVQAYTFTATSIIAALARAHGRGVDVSVVLDKSNDRGTYSGATYLENTGVPVWIDLQPAIAHSKVIIIDWTLVIGGSHNYTQAAEQKNAENITFTTSPVVAGWFLDNWDSRMAASRPYVSVPTN
jgi:phosphatidylserine/phosphatidylglycerophosphate/cardiolipin synthase-like enzyme